VSLIKSRELFSVVRLTSDLGYQDFEIALLEHLLKHLPNHVAARCVLGERLVALERWSEAQEHFEWVLGVEPISLSALRGMGCIALAQGSAVEESEHLRRARELYPYDATIRQLLNETLGDISPLSLGRILSVSSLHEEALPYYEAAFDQALDRPSEQPITVLLLTEALWKTGRMERARSLLETLIAQQPSWVRPKLILADIALGMREDALGAALLHDANALDSSLLVAQEFFGEDERYYSVMGDSLEVPAPGPELLDGAPKTLRYILRAEPLPDPFTLGVQTLDKSAPSSTLDRKGGDVIAADERIGDVAYVSLAGDQLEEEDSASGSEQGVPIRLILSSRDRLVAKYGDHGYRELDLKLLELCEATAQSTGHEVIRAYVDDDTCLAEYGLDCVDSSDPHDVARLIQQLESELTRRYKKVRSLLIVGGDSVIPFHRLANPTDDEDIEVLSDWPYAGRDANALLSRFGVGRMPDGNSADFEMLLSSLDNAIRHHTAKARDRSAASSSKWPRRILRKFGSKREAVSSVGYSADIWAEASRSVFDVIGDSGNLMLSPPSTDYDFLSTYGQVPTLAYFNLHGFQGSSYWYGHGESEHGSQLLPVALTPLSVSWTDAEAALVYTEACYGADLRDHCTDGSIALSFFANGALAFVGFTAMSYGALVPPLSGADLLGRYLWKGIAQGLPIGLALHRARLAFIGTAAANQGYLDGEDQKTLLSCVLYGDPSVGLAQGPAPPESFTDVEVSCPPLACNARMLEAELLPVSADLLEKVQHSVPFLSMSGIKARPLILCRGACSAKKCDMQGSTTAPQGANSLPEFIVTSREEAVSKGGNHLEHVIRVTVNAEGDVTKVLVSRGGICIGEGSRWR
jgi:tetratricopeptide (TPR) repeat protein